MRKEHGRNVCIVLLLLALLLSVLAGCGGGDGQKTDGNTTGTDAPAISDTGNGETPPPEDSGDEAGHDPAPPEGDTVTVGSVEELLEAIGPHTEILLKPGYYNMSEYIEYVWAKEGESWNERHPYVQLRSCADGVEVVIRRVDGLSICGDNKNLTEIVVEPRYAQVLNFEECHNLTLSGLTMGHTSPEPAPATCWTFMAVGISPSAPWTSTAAASTASRAMTAPARCMFTAAPSGTALMVR